MHWAALNGHAEVTSALLKMGASPTIRHKSGNTPLHFAALNGHTAVARLLIDGGADLAATNHVRDLLCDFAAID
jgi:ankyrin repeat protein